MERALLVEVTTYGSLHAGVEPLHREVLKRTWPLLPGWTLFGAVQAALVRLDGVTGAGPSTLVDALASGRLRFAPLLPDQGRTIHDACSYCEQAGRLLAAEGGQRTQETPDLRYQTTPHAPLGRRHEQIQGSLLYAVECHGSEQVYRGWIFCDEGTEAALRRGLTLLPFLPFGGKGKYTAAEALLETGGAEQDAFAEALAEAITERCAGEVVLRFATPVVVEGADPGLLGEARRMSPRPPRRYRVWRTGVYPHLNGGRRVYGTETDAQHELAWQGGDGYLTGQTSEAVVALPEGSTFVFGPDKAPAIAAAFVRGLGRQDWASLGWGQSFVQFGQEEATDG